MTTRLLRPFRALARLVGGLRRQVAAMPPQEPVMLVGLVLVAIALGGVDWRLAVGVPGAILVLVALGFSLAPRPRS